MVITRPSGWRLSWRRAGSARPWRSSRASSRGTSHAITANAASPTEVPFANTAMSVNGLVAVGNYVLAQDESEVVLTHTDPHGASQQVRCAWLVGCDGASSSIRNALGLNLEGETFVEGRDATAVLVLTWVVTTDARELYVPVWDYLLQTYKIPDAE